jgi:hypothetical protein
MWKIGLFDAVLHRRWRGQSDCWWSSAVALQGEAANRPELLRSRAVVVSVRGERRAVSASGVGQEDERKRSTDDVSKSALDDIETGRPAQSGMSLASACLLARWCPAWRWRELGLGSGVERGNLSSRARGRQVAPAWACGRSWKGELQAADPRGVAY